VSQGPRGSCLMKKNSGRKSRVRVPLKGQSHTMGALAAVKEAAGVLALTYFQR
jgi:hypothetical protein